MGVAPDTFAASIEAVKARLREAAETLWALPRGRHDLPDGYSSTWPAMIRGAYEAYGYHGDPWKLYRRSSPRPAVPSRARVDRMDEVLGWMLWLTAKQRICVWGHAAPRSSLRKIARSLKKRGFNPASKTSVDRWEQDGIRRIVVRLVGQERAA